MKNPHAQALGRLGKGKTSEAKKAAARRNGTAPVKPGSKPRGRPRKGNDKAEAPSLSEVDPPAAG